MVNFTIGELTFKTKKEATQYTKDKIYNMKIGEKDIKCNDYKFIMELLDNHPEKRNKIGSGIKCFVLEERFKHRHILIKREDLTEEYFSWCACSGKPKKTDNTYLNIAFRSAINKQIIECRNKSKCCIECGNAHNIEIHHDKKTFSELVIDFKATNKDLIPTVFDKDIYGIVKFKRDDIRYEMKWRRYHRKNSCLIPLCEKCHNNITYKKCVLT